MLLQIASHQQSKAKGVILIERCKRSAEAVDVDEAIIGAAGLPRQRYLDPLGFRPFAQPPLRFHMRE